MGAFSAGMQGPNRDEYQPALSQYFTMYVEPDAATKFENLLWNAMIVKGNPWRKPLWTEPAQLQKGFNWYNGAITQVGALAAPPVMQYGDIANISSSAAGLRAMWGNGTTPAGGIPQRKDAKPGKVSVPVTLLCGADDPFILCNRPFSRNTKKYCTGQYEFVLLPKCGHDIMNCEASASTQKAIDKIVENV